MQATSAQRCARNAEADFEPATISGRMSPQPGLGFASSADTPTLISVGVQSTPRKGYRTSLGGFCRSQARYPAARYLIIGSYLQNAYFAQLAGMIRDRIEDVVFLGALPQAESWEKYYQQASLYRPGAAAGRPAFFGRLVFLEAGAYGLPVVATRSRRVCLMQCRTG